MPTLGVSNSYLSRVIRRTLKIFVAFYFGETEITIGEYRSNIGPPPGGGGHRKLVTQNGVKN